MMKVRTTMKCAHALATALSLCAFALTAYADVETKAEDIHLPQGKTTSMTWTVNDGTDTRWDFNSSGNVEGGSNGAYSGCLYLNIADGNSFSSSGTAILSKDEREIELGPWQYNNMNVSRRMYVDPKKPYARWIDIFENRTGQDYTINLRYVLRMGSSVNEVATSSGKADIAARDWAFATTYKSDSSRPSVVHVFSSKGCKAKPTVTITKGQTEMQYNYTLTVPAGKAAALCFFESQHPTFDKAKDFMKDFDPRAELEKVPAGLRKIIVNMAIPTFSLEGIELPREEKADLAVMRKGGELRGTIVCEKFAVATAFGKVELDAAKVLGMASPAESGSLVQLAMVDGQMITGKLTSPLAIKLDNGTEMKLSPKEFRSVAYRISKERPQEITCTNAFVVLRSGQRLFFQAGNAEVDYRTVYGKIKLDAKQVSAIHFDTADGGLHRVEFRSGSVVSGILDPNSLTFKLSLGMDLPTRVENIRRIEFPGEPAEPDAARATLRNDDELVGALAETQLEIQTDNGKVTAKPDEIDSLEFSDTGLGQVQIKLKNNNSFSGKIMGKRLKFKLDNGPELSVFVGHFAGIKFPSGSGGATTPETRQPDSQPMSAEEKVRHLKLEMEARARKEALEQEARAREVDKLHEARARAAKEDAARKAAAAAK